MRYALMICADESHETARSPEEESALLSEYAAFGEEAGRQGVLLDARMLIAMCRNIRVLHNFEPPATREEVRAAALQYVRKIAGTTSPSRINERAFERAVDAVERASMRLLGELVTSAPPRNREAEAGKARQRAAARYARG